LRQERDDRVSRLGFRDPVYIVVMRRGVRFLPDSGRAVFPVAVLAAAVALSGCLSDAGETEAPPPAPPPDWPAIAWPADNPYTPEKADLGRLLFFDTRLSSDGVISCSWCHSERASFADNHHTPMSTGVGQQPTRRNVPTLVNVAFATSLHLDGSRGSLEEQALGPLLAPDEMDMTPEAIVAVAEGDSVYRRLFRAAFGAGPVTLDKTVKALATYQRTLISTQSPYDAWRAGDTAALTLSQRRGLVLFNGKGGCVACHAPPLFTDRGFHNIGLDSVTVDPGRAGVTGISADEGKFKTPTLRNVRQTYPYMHDGRFQELRDVVEHYNTGGRAHPARDARIRPLGLTYAESSDLIAFLEGLSDRHFLDRHNP
jgi:cytochrome c peroxidase